MRKEMYKTCQWLLTLLMMGAVSAVHGQISGFVFRDYNASGTRETVQASPFVGEPGVSNVTVTAYPSGAGSPVSTVTAADGSFSLSTSAGVWRVEISNIPSYLKPGAAGRTTVEFISNGTSNVLFGLNNPADYSQTNPYLVVPDHIFGSRTDPSNASLSALDFVNHTWGNTTKGSSPEWDVTPWQQPQTPGTLGTVPQLGSLYGVAWDRTHNYVYAAAYHKNFVDYGPGGPGMIYRIPVNPQTGAATGAPQQWVNVSNFSGNSMPCYHGSDLSAGVDNTVLDYVGKCGLGDLDISEDDQYLYVVNLTNRKVLQIRTSDGGLNNSWDFPTSQASCTGNPNDIRPFGLGIKDGLVYVGAVCSRESLESSYFPPDPPNNNGRIYVHTLNPQSGTWNEVLNAYAGRDNWNPWISNHTKLLTSWRNGGENQYNYVQIPQPMLTDIEFYGDDMILGIRDRCGDIWGSRIPDPLDGTPLISTIGTGDIVTATPNGSGGYTMEANQVCGNRTASPAAKDITFLPTGQHQFYWADGWHQNNSTLHFEQSFGGLAQILLEPVAMTSLTPTNAFDAAQAEKGGVLWMSDLTGAPSRAYVLYHDNALPGSTSGHMAKANGLGDIEALSLPAPLEIGNRIWDDTDSDGVQDAGESGIAGIAVNIYSGATQVGTTTTSSDGTWYFNNANVTMNGATGLLPNTAYTIRVASGAFPSGKTLTTQNVGGSGQPDVRDNDAALVSGNAEISYTTGTYGQNDHTLDIGFKTNTCDPDSFGLCAGGSYTLTAGAGLNTYQWFRNGATISGANAQTYIANQAGLYTWTALDGTGCSYLDCCGVQLFDSVCCIVPTLTLSHTAPTCVGATAQNNGKITLAAVTNGTHYGVSTLNAGSYDGPVFASATAISGTPDIKTGIPNTGGTYIVRIFNGSNTCYKDTTLTVAAVVCTCPTVTAAISGTTTVCNGGTTTLTASGGGTYAWSSGESTAAITKGAGTYTVTVTVSGCTSTSSVTVTNTNVTAAISGGTTVCNGGTTTLTASGGGTYVWSSGESTAAITKSAGTYTVTVTVSGCTSTSSVTVTNIATTVSLTLSPPGCTGPTVLNNGIISITAVSNGTHYGVSSLNAGSYDGPAFASATAISGLPDVKTGIPNTGGSYIVRIYNGSNTCYIEQTVNVAPVVCTCPTGNCLPITVTKN